MEFDISTYDVRCIFFLGGSRQQEVVSRLLYNFCARQTAITSYSIRAPPSAHPPREKSAENAASALLRIRFEHTIIVVSSCDDGVPILPACEISSRHDA